MGAAQARAGEPARDHDGLPGRRASAWSAGTTSSSLGPWPIRIAQQRRAERSADIANVNLIRRSIEVGDVSRRPGRAGQARPRRTRNRRSPRLRVALPAAAVRLRAAGPLGDRRPGRVRWRTAPTGRRSRRATATATIKGFEDRPGEVQVRDAETGPAAPGGSRHTGARSSTSPSAPTAARIATAGADRTAKIWDAGTGKLVHTSGRAPVRGQRRCIQPRRQVGRDRQRLPLCPHGGLVLEADPPGRGRRLGRRDRTNVWRETESAGAVLRGVLFAPSGRARGWRRAARCRQGPRPGHGPILWSPPAMAGSRLPYSADGRSLIT